MLLDSQEIAENKIIILYILDAFHMPLVESQLTHFVLEKAFMNYFVFKQHFSELLHTNMIDSSSNDGLKYYQLSSLGHKTLDMFSNLLSEEYQNILTQEVLIKKKHFMDENEVIANYIQLKDNEYMVNLMAIEKGTPLLDLRLTVFSEEECIKICTNWRKNATHHFKKIIQIIT